MGSNRAARRTRPATRPQSSRQLGLGSTAALFLSGHTDVVPVDGQPWSNPPFKLRQASGRLYGRGACDMKGFDACVLAMAPAFRDAGLKHPVHIVLSYDEETTCLGSRDVIAQFGNRRAAAGYGNCRRADDDGGRRRAQERGDLPNAGHRAGSPFRPAGAWARTRSRRRRTWSARSAVSRANIRRARSTRASPRPIRPSMSA